MKSDFLTRMQKELDDWRPQLEGLRVKASLAKLELRDRREDVLKSFDSAYGTAKRELGEWKESAEGHLHALSAGVEAGWEELRETYDKVRAENKE